MMHSYCLQPAVSWWVKANVCLMCVCDFKTWIIQNNPRLRYVVKLQPRARQHTVVVCGQHVCVGGCMHVCSRGVRKSECISDICCRPNPLWQTSDIMNSRHAEQIHSSIINESEEERNRGRDGGDFRERKTLNCGKKNWLSKSIFGVRSKIVTQKNPKHSLKKK